MPSQRKAMFLYQTLQLLSLLSLSSLALASDHAIFRPLKVHTIKSDLLPSEPTHPHPNTKGFITPLDLSTFPDTETLTCPPTHKQCANTCIPSTQDCCSASEHCFPGDYCFFHAGQVRCCPQGLECFQMSGDVCLSQTVVWYEAVLVVAVTEGSGGDVDSGDGGGSEEATATTTTLWDLQSEERHTRTRVTVSASYPAEGRRVYESVSASLKEALATTVMVWGDGVPTRTRTVVSLPTVTAMEVEEKEELLGEMGEGEGQVVLG
ncbi:hypothetical protein BJY04DRAFT_199220 [Aspergillus karnatakaensis]|uniref:uncharacterized protein n=1 Tax=Aspergillus karnatakaensis TaxID=1810916 RepID=UPI003CCCD06E